MAIFGIGRQSGKSQRVSMPMELALSRSHRLRLVGEGVLVGVCAGILISAYRFALFHAEEALRFITQHLADMGLYFVWFTVLAFLLVVVGKLMLWEPHTQGSGIPQLDAEVAGKIDMDWRRVIPAKFVEGTLCAFAGLSLGREGPSVQLGAMAGKGVSRGLGNGRPHERLLCTCGAAAGMSAAFHAPLSGILFALEEIHKGFSAPLIISVMASSVVADFVSSHLLGFEPQIHFMVFSEIPLRLYAAVVLLGALCGVLGALHNRGMFACQERVFDHISHFAPYSRMVIPFAMAGVCAFLAPDLMCGGDAIVERIQEARGESATLLIALLVGKYAFTTICFASGAPGGTLFPLVVMGALAGAIFGVSASGMAGISGSYVSEFCALGITGLFAAVIQAPVTAVVLVFELTGSFDALLAASFVSLIAYLVATLLKTEPYYEHLLARLLGSVAEKDEALRKPRDSEKVLRTYVVGVGSCLEGMTVRDVRWPSDSLVVTIRRAGAETFVHGDTRIAALDELCVLMHASSEQADDETLHRLCAARTP